MGAFEVAVPSNHQPQPKHVGAANRWHEGRMLKGEKEHATVIGASMAGMLAARVLADWFELMTVVERAVLPDSPQDGQSVSRS